MGELKHPLLTEFEKYEGRFDSLRAPRAGAAILFRTLGVSASVGVRPKRAAAVFAALGLLSIALSIAGHAAYIKVFSKADDGSGSENAYGFLRDPTAGLFFAVLAPAIVYLGLEFLRASGETLSQMCRSGLLRGGSETDTIAAIGNANRRCLASFIVLGLVILSFGVSFALELWPWQWPRLGDHYTTAWGYNQAYLMATYYPTGVLLTKGNLGGRDPKGVPCLTKKPNGPTNGLEILFFRSFLVVGLFTAGLFAMIAFWFAIKLALVLGLFAAAIAAGCGHSEAGLPRFYRWLSRPPQHGSSVGRVFEIQINGLDPNRNFGLTAVILLVQRLGWLVTVCAATIIIEFAQHAGTDAISVEKYFSEGHWADLRGAGGGGLVSFVIISLCLVALRAIQVNLERFRESLMNQDGLTPSQYDQVSLQKFSVLKQVLSLGAPGGLSGAGLVFLVLKDPTKLAHATQNWDRISLVVNDQAAKLLAAIRLG